MSASIRDAGDLTRVLDDQVGIRLFTVLHWRADDRVLRRLFTNQPGDYPVGGTKTVEVSQEWLSRTVDDHEATLGRDRTSVRETFADHETIDRLGCGAFITVPITVGTEMVVLCLLDAEHHYDDDSLRRVRSLEPDAEQALRALLEETM